METRNDPLPISSLVRFEFLHGIHREVFRNANDRMTGLSLSVAVGVIGAFEDDYKSGRLQAVEIDLPRIIKRAETLSKSHATARGHKAFDTLQRTLAEAEGISVPL
jgi:hypothetical protein